MVAFTLRRISLCAICSFFFHFVSSFITSVGFFFAFRRRSRSTDERWAFVYLGVCCTEANERKNTVGVTYKYTEILHTY